MNFASTTAMVVAMLASGVVTAVDVSPNGFVVRHDLAMSGSMTWRLLPAASGTRLELRYSVGGFIEGGFERIAPAVETLLVEQAERLKRYAETGSAGAAK